MDDEKGQIQPGMLADLTVLSGDVTKETTDLLGTDVLYTIVGGQIVFERE